MTSSDCTLKPTRWLWLTEEFDMNGIDLCGQTLEDESQLQEPLGFMKWFTDMDKCVDYIENVQDASLVILTIAGRFARHVMPRIHHLRQLLVVYVICKPENNERNQAWSKSYDKVIIRSYNKTLKSIRNLLGKRHFFKKRRLF